jgi:hypothetical protein
MLDAALDCARIGFDVLPVKPSGKRPLTPHGVKDATTDEATIRARWRRWPNANIGIACGASGIVILDADRRNGSEHSMPQLLEALKRDGVESSYGLAKTPGGSHWVFQEPRDPALRNLLGNGCTALLPGIDVLAGERYFVAPPSSRADGDYKWVRAVQSIDALPEFPSAVIQMIREHRKGAVSHEGAGTPSARADCATIRLGNRNQAAFETACTLARQGLGEQAICEELRGMRDRGTFEPCTRDPFTNGEIAALVVSAVRAVSHPSPVDEAKEAWPDERPWPKLHPSALYGLAGELVRAIERETEADPAALLATLLVGFGNAIGASAHANVHADLHPGRFFAAIVGSTSTGGKGTSLATITPFLKAADPLWFEGCRMSGFGSGEALISQVSGAFRAKDDTDPIEKRAFVIEPEFARLLTINAREGSTLSPILRAAWDDGRLELRHSKARMVATGAHVSLLAHITPDELREKLGSIEVASGFANRVLFVLSRRSRKLPAGGQIPSDLVMEYASQLTAAIRFARGVGKMRRSVEAEALWEQTYNEEPDREGVIGTVCDRWQAQKLRLSVIYALLDHSATIGPEHVIAAEAFWRYCVASAEWIWGGASGDRITDRILKELRSVYPAGVSRDDARGLFARHISSDRLTAALDNLCQHGLARIEKERTEGRSREILYAIPLRGKR